MTVEKQIVKILEDFTPKLEEAILNDDYIIDSQEPHYITIVILGERVSIWTANGGRDTSPYMIVSANNNIHFPNTCTFKARSAIFEVLQHKLKTFDFGVEEHH